MRKLTLLLLLVSVFIICSIVMAEELPKCPKCKQTIYSSWWKYCSACGTKLTDFKISGDSEGNEIILGNVYKNKEWLFQIDKPSERWKFFTVEDAKEVNRDSLLTIESESAYAMVIPEGMGDITLKDYEKLVIPKLDDMQVASRKVTNKGDYERSITEVEGSYQNAKIRWEMAIYKRGDNFYQVHCWASACIFEKHHDECETIINSFKFIE